MATLLLPWAAVPGPGNLLREELFPNIQPELALAQLEGVSSFPVTSCLGEASCS